MNTYGRNPTFAEIKEYYAREDVLSFLYDMCHRREVILSFKEEPSWRAEHNSPRLKPANVAELNQIIVDSIASEMSGITDTTRPMVYPSFHAPIDDDSGKAIGDFAIEADCEGWRRSFADVRSAIEILNRFDVPYITKFSGHRSLHLMIPREAFPEEFNGRPMSQSWKDVQNSLRTFFHRYAAVQHAHRPGNFLRLPYSLNENTGMVSIPIKPDYLDDFRPWEAFPHLVEVDAILFDIPPEGIARTAEFLYAALVEKCIEPLQNKIWLIGPKQHLEKYQEIIGDVADLPSQLKSPDSSARAEAAWKLMVSRSFVPDELISQYSEETNPDVRWFIAEALSGDERVLALLGASDEYVADAVMDAAVPLATELVANLSDESSLLKSSSHSRNLYAVFERAGDSIQDALLDQAATTPEERSLNLFRYASLMGCITNNWDISDKMEAIFQQRFSNWTEISDVLSQQVVNHIRQLNSDDREASMRAEAALIKDGTNATKALVLAMGTQNLWVRKRIIKILSEIGDENAVECLVEALGDKGGKVRSFAMSGVLKLGVHAIPFLRKAVKSDSPRLRSNATKVLGMIDENDARDAALTSLTDRDPKVRKTGVKTLSRVGDQQIVNHLKNMIGDENEQVGFEAAFALAKIEAGGEVLKTALHSDSRRVRCAAAHGLAKIGDASGIDILIETLGSEGWSEWMTPRMLVELGEERGIEGLLTFVKKHLHEDVMSSATILAAGALGQIKDARATAILKEMLFAHHDRKTRRTAVKALLEIGTPETIEAFIEALQSRDGQLRQHACNALANIGEVVIPRLKEILEGTTGKPRKSILGVLKMLGET